MTFFQLKRIIGIFRAALAPRWIHQNFITFVSFCVDMGKRALMQGFGLLDTLAFIALLDWVFTFLAGFRITRIRWRATAWWRWVTWVWIRVGTRTRFWTFLAFPELVIVELNQLYNVSVGIDFSFNYFSNSRVQNGHQPRRKFVDVMRLIKMALKYLCRSLCM